MNKLDVVQRSDASRWTLGKSETRLICVVSVGEESISRSSTDTNVSHIHILCSDLVDEPSFTLTRYPQWLTIYIHHAMPRYTSLPKISTTIYSPWKESKDYFIMCIRRLFFLLILDYVYACILFDKNVSS